MSNSENEHNYRLRRPSFFPGGKDEDNSESVSQDAPLDENSSDDSSSESTLEPEIAAGEAPTDTSDSTSDSTSEVESHESENEPEAVVAASEATTAETPIVDEGEEPAREAGSSETEGSTAFSSEDPVEAAENEGFRLAPEEKEPTDDEKEETPSTVDALAAPASADGDTPAEAIDSEAPIESTEATEREEPDSSQPTIAPYVSSVESNEPKAEESSLQTPPEPASASSVAPAQPRRRSAALPWVIAGVLAVGLIGSTSYQLSGTHAPGAPSSLKSEKEVCDVFSKADLECTVTRELSDSVPGGQLIKQSVDAGDRASKGKTVEVVYSEGPATSKMPDVSNVPLEYASSMLSEAGLTISESTEVDNSGYPSGYVVSTNVKPGANVSNGDEIVLNISSGKQVAPDFAGMSADQAITSAEKAGIEAKIEWVEAPAYSDFGIVESQSVEAGDAIEDGLITLEVTRPAEGVALQIPDVVGKTQDEALSDLYDEGITMLNIVEVEGDEDKVLDVSPSEAQYVSSSTVVTVVVETADSED